MINRGGEHKVMDLQEDWYAELDAEGFEQFIAHMMPKVMNEVSYEYHIKILYLLGIIHSTEPWLSRTFKKDDKELVIKWLEALLKNE